jgi:hypothetical protein
MTTAAGCWPFKINGPDEPSALAPRAWRWQTSRALGPCDHLSPEKKAKARLSGCGVVFEGKTSHSADDLGKHARPRHPP